MDRRTTFPEWPFRLGWNGINGPVYGVINPEEERYRQSQEKVREANERARISNEQRRQLESEEYEEAIRRANEAADYILNLDPITNIHSSDTIVYTTEETTYSMNIPYDNYDVLFVDVEGLNLDEGIDYTIELGQIVFTNPIVHEGTGVHFCVLYTDNDLYRDDVTKARAFESVPAMKREPSLKFGMICHTLGYYNSGDGGAAWYFITDSADANDMDIIELNNDFYAYMIEGDYVTPEQLGAVNYTATNWSSSNSYDKFDVVKHGCNLYVATQDVPTGIIIDNFTYWYKCNTVDNLSVNLTQEVENRENADIAINAAIDKAISYITPDMFEGADDTAKLQNCIDSLADENGNMHGVIMINRTYTIARDINITNRTDVSSAFIKFIGLGKNAGFHMENARFTNSTVTLPEWHDNGGVSFENITFTSNDVTTGNTNSLIDSDKLIRVFVINCVFKNCYSAFGGNNAQSAYFQSCYFWNILHAGVYIHLTAYDINFNQCVCEHGYGLYKHDYDTENVQPSYSVKFNQCTVEGITDRVAIDMGIVFSASITSCYFEGVYIELTNSKQAKGIDVSDNIFVVTGIAAIHLPVYNLLNLGKFTNNTQITASGMAQGYLFTVTDQTSYGTTQLNCYIAGNTTDTDAEWAPTARSIRIYNQVNNDTPQIRNKKYSYVATVTAIALGANRLDIPLPLPFNLTNNVKVGIKEITAVNVGTVSPQPGQTYISEVTVGVTAANYIYKETSQTYTPNSVYEAVAKYDITIE